MRNQTLMELTDLVVEETVSVFLTACEMNLTSCDSTIFNHMEPAIFSIIELEGDLDCSFFLCIPQETAEEMSPRFLEIEIPFDSEDMDDIVGELNNMLCGSLKTALSRQGYNITINVPSKIRFENLCQLKERDFELTATGYDSKQGKLWSGFVVKKSEQKVTHGLSEAER